jgi:hypothetical protein
MLTDYQRSLYSGDWVEKQDKANKTVICIKCLTPYNLLDVPRNVPKASGYYIKEPHCPKCKCRVYYN